MNLEDILRQGQTATRDLWVTDRELVGETWEPGYEYHIQITVVVRPIVTQTILERRPLASAEAGGGHSAPQSDKETLHE